MVPVLDVNSQPAVPLCCFSPCMVLLRMLTTCGSVLQRPGAWSSTQSHLYIYTTEYQALRLTVWATAGIIIPLKHARTAARLRVPPALMTPCSPGAHARVIPGPAGGASTAVDSEGTLKDTRVEGLGTHGR